MTEMDVPLLLGSLALNVVAITILIFGVYFRRHRRADLLLGYFAFNVSLFTVASALASASPLSIGVGFGLFAVLSIVRLRNDESTQAETRPRTGAAPGRTAASGRSAALVSARADLCL